MKYLILFAFVVSALAYNVPHLDHEELFANWMAEHHKVYDSSEFAVRFNNFKDSLANIAELNKNPDGVVYGLNAYSDMSDEEFRSKVLMPPQETVEVGQTREFIPAPGAPTVYDWRDHAAVTAVKNQASCGSCWAFSATEAIESAWILAGHATASSLNLAPQQIVDCDRTDNGCGGGWPDKAMTYVHNAGGQEGENNYPYTAKDGSCHFQNQYVVAKVGGYKSATKTGDETTLQNNLLAWGPVSICLDASQWQHYSSGVLTPAQCCSKTCQLDHCTQLVGYNTTSSPHYWIVRNSWGASWGVHGYIHLQMGSNTCALTNHATWPTM